ncbi:ABC-2 transporter permease [uncultured Eubacterium sp.]|uniref:ABC-2 transporter permease n=1 Tax=uncultured Eubacterium sp. TaxID=165185 RepID=UPI0025FC5D40|nr:ABC-2 transporter permease [uncultured Eubacterium sp.]
MRGLLEKDIRLLMHSKQTFLCFIAIAIVLGVTQKNTFLLGYSTFLIAALLVSTLSYDELDHGFAFLFTLPIDRKMYVREKYLLCIGGSIIAWFIALVLYFIVLTVSGSHSVFSEEMVKGLAFLPVAILFLSLLLPLQIKFGVEKSRLVVLGVSVFAGIMIYFLAEKSGMLDGNVVVSAFGLIGDSAVDVIGLLVAGCLAVVSYLCSCRIMKKKEL